MTKFLLLFFCLLCFFESRSQSSYQDSPPDELTLFSEFNNEDGSFGNSFHPNIKFSPNSDCSFFWLESTTEISRIGFPYSVIRVKNVFDENKLLERQYSFGIDASGNEIPFQAKVFEYSSELKIIRETILYWNETTQEYVIDFDSEEVQIIYDQNDGRLLEKRFFSYFNGQREPKYLHNYTYSEGKEIVLRREWDDFFLRWKEPDIKLELIYKNDKIDYAEFFEPNSSLNNPWKVTKRFDYSYDENSNRLTGIVSSLQFTDELIPSGLQQFDYNEDGDINAIIRYGYNFLLELRVISIKGYFYNEDKNLVRWEEYSVDQNQTTETRKIKTFDWNYQQCEQITLIPDENFEQELINQNIDSDGIVNGQVFTKDIAELVLLRLNDSQIQSISGIQDFVSLKELSLHSNQLTQVDLSKNLNLEVLDLSSNNLSTIDLEKNILLESLKLDGNLLQSVDIGSNQNLILFYASNNQIDEIDLSNNSKLQYLSLENNQLTELTVSNISQLIELVTAGNELACIEVNSNQFESIPLDWSVDSFTSFSLECTNNDSDSDGDGVPDDLDLCPNEYGSPPTGCRDEPSIENQVFSVDENSPNGTLVGQIIAIDYQGEDLTYIIWAENYDQPQGAFQVEETTGNIYVLDSSLLDYETNPSFGLNIRVTDESFLWSNGDITINLNDVDESINTVPVVSDAEFIINENSSVGSFVGTVNATDAEGDVLFYSIVSGNELGAFQINSGTGEISVFDSSPLDYETNPNFVLTVNVSDGQLNGTAQIEVTLIDIFESDNIGPTVQDTTFVIDENAANGTVVGTVPATDPNDDFLIYLLMSESPVSGAFEIVDFTGEILVLDSSLLDFESYPSFELEVAVNDGVYNDRGIMTIELNDIDESGTTLPSFNSIDVTELTSTGACITIDLNDGGEIVTSKGIQYGLSESSFDGENVEGSGSNTFTSCIEGLVPSTIYFFRAFAENINGTAYSVTGSFMTLEESNLDTDADGIPDDEDSCQDTPDGAEVDAFGCSDSQKDTDGDGVMDDVDQCPNSAQDEQVDENGCPISVVDIDSDGIADDLDSCPDTPFGEEVDGNGCSDSQKDTDGDGVMDDVDQCPNSAQDEQIDENGCPIESLDADSDGVPDNEDSCQDTPVGEIVDLFGCSDSQKDSDGDGVTDDIDLCPNSAQDGEVDENGCPISVVDTDSDGIADNLDNCPDTPSGEVVDGNGCSDSQIDTDGDGAMDDVDQCPNSAQDEQVDENGCPISVVDIDSDGISDDLDSCPDTPFGEEVDGNGCSDSQKDSDGDGVMDNIDQCPNSGLGATVDFTGCEVFVLPLANFSLQSIGETCSTENDGKIVLSAIEPLDYSVILSSGLISRQYQFNSDLTIEGLESGTYELCISVDGKTGYKRCFEVFVTEPESISVNSKTNMSSNSVTLSMSGSSFYRITVNGEQYQTTKTTITIPLDKVVNEITVYGDKDCQGLFQESIVLSDSILVYPNPVGNEELTVFLGSTNEFSKINARVITIDGRTVINKRIDVNDGYLHIDLNGLELGTYMLSLQDGNEVFNKKIIKR